MSDRQAKLILLSLAIVAAVILTYVFGTGLGWWR